MKQIRRVFIGLALGLPLLSHGDPHWPSKPIKLVVAYPPGSMGDVIARLIQPTLQQRLGGAVVIENKPGAGGNIAAASVAKASPDGYTYLLAASNNFVANQFLYRNVGYDPDRDLVSVGIAADVPAVVFINAKSGVTTFADFAKSSRNAASFNFGSPGNGTIPHLIAESLNQSAKLSLTHIPYGGTPAVVTAMLSDQVQMMVVGAGIGAPFVKSGQFVPIAYGGKSRSPDMANVPTLAELGYSDIRGSTWWAIAAPAKTPNDIIAKFSDAMKESLLFPAVREKLRQDGVNVVGSTPQGMDSVVAEERVVWKAAITRVGIKLD